MSDAPEKIRDGEAWRWLWKGWRSAPFAYLEQRPWTPIVIGGRLCFTVSNLPMDDDVADTPEQKAARKWAAVWGDAAGPWFDDVARVVDIRGRPAYRAVLSEGDTHRYVAVWGDQRSQDFEEQIAIVERDGAPMIQRFDPRRGPVGPDIAPEWRAL